MRMIAVDWSGARAGAERKIWLAEARDGVLVQLEAGRSREALVQHLNALAGHDGELVVGLDFAFSLPAWWLRERGFADAPALWRWLAAGNADRLLAECAAPFWGRRGSKRWANDERIWRLADRMPLPGAGRSPKSVFQIGGPGAVGTGSIRGMPLLLELQRAGFTIWPFDQPARPPLAVEIYPRAFTGDVRKSSKAARIACLRDAGHAARMTAAMREDCERSDDAFDAAISALGMWDHRDALCAVQAMDHARVRLEGMIWHPRLDAAAIVGAAL